MLFLGLILIIVGLVMLIKPDVFWSITESWKSNDGTEPSDLYLLSTRIGGVLFTIVGIGGAIVSFL